MRAFMINTVCGVGSTGRICCALATAVERAGGESLIAYGRGDVPADCGVSAVRIQSRAGVLTDALLTRLSDCAGSFSRAATRRLIAQLERFDPDVVHLHNLHGYYLNVKMLLDYLASSGRAGVWTLHDCWALTGHCCHFSRVGCDRWRTGCHHCPQRGAYPAAWWADRSADNYRRKRELLTALPSLRLVTPSRWLASQVEQSYLGNYPVHVVPNGIDLSVFRPSSQAERHAARAALGLGERPVVLGAASVWSESKGLARLCELAALPEAPYCVVAVGLTDKQIAALPRGMIGLPRVGGAAQMAQLYGMADVFVNPSVEETMGMTTLEAMACGVPVVTSAQTAVPEVVDADGGLVVAKECAAAYDAAIRAVLSQPMQPRRSAERYGLAQMCEGSLAVYRAAMGCRNGNGGER